MARAKLNPLLAQLRGAIGDLVFKQYGDRVVVTRRPRKSSKPPSEKQLAHRRRFRVASTYGRFVSETPEVRAIYEPRAKAEKKAVYTIALGDAMNRPVVEEIGVSALGEAGGRITVRATDDFEVVRVQVAVIGAAGEVLEEGDAQLQGERWVIETRTPRDQVATVRALAFDRPGNVGEGMVAVA